MSLHPRLVIAGTHSGVGKTTATLAILTALKARGRLVQAFKVGPDFIDPGHHSMATGRPSHNLDGWMLEKSVNRRIFARGAADAEISIIEGMMGLFDGSSAVNGIGSTAELAKQLAAPVLLMIDAGAMARSVAAMATGYAKFDADLRVAGVLFNRVGSEGHYRLLKEAVESQTDLAVVGYLKSDPSMTVPDRHLGLVTAVEQDSGECYGRFATAAMDTIDLGLIESLAASAGVLPEVPPSPSLIQKAERHVRIGVAYDPAFCFYYQDNLALLEGEGAELVKFSPMSDECLPNVDMLYLGGGYPELYGERLAGNVTMRQAIRSFAAGGGVIYAECGGMMYLTQAIRDFDGCPHEMVGLFPAETRMHRSSMTLGYRTIVSSRPCILGEAGVTARGHEFRYSTLESKGSLENACVLIDAQGISRGQDGLVVDNVLGLYTHLHFASQPQIAQALVTSACGSSARSSVTARGAQ